MPCSQKCGGKEGEEQYVAALFRGQIRSFTQRHYAHTTLVPKVEGEGPALSLYRPREGVRRRCMIFLGSPNQWILLLFSLPNKGVNGKSGVTPQERIDKCLVLGWPVPHRGLMLGCGP